MKRNLKYAIVLLIAAPVIGWIPAAALVALIIVADRDRDRRNAINNEDRK